ncbi:MAG: discoidin domain-containing protein [Acidobacteriaceae bacterium]
MRSRSSSLLHLLWIVLLLLSSGVLPAQQPATPALHIEVQDKNGTRIIDSATAIGSLQTDSTTLDFHRVYQPGDRILFTEPQEMAVRMDQSMPECLIFAPNSSALIYEIPYGRAEQETGSAYAPDAFSGDSHRVTLRALTGQERDSYRNLALNPCDQPRPDLAIFPHATSSSVARNLFDFEARNAIDGATRNGHHGVWPYQSWGPELSPDVWWKVDFGRPVTVDKVRLMLRADFPHDGTWKSAEIEFSDGSRVAIQLAPTAEFQEFTFPARRTAWLRLTNLLPTDPGKWCGLIELEAWGRE